MKMLKIALLAAGATCLNMNMLSAQEEPLSEAVQAIKTGLVSKQGDATELVKVDEAAVQKLESLAEQGKDVKDAVDFLESRIGFDPRKKALNEQTLQPVRERLGKALKRQADIAAAKVAPAA